MTGYFYSVYGHPDGESSDSDRLETIASLSIKDWRQFESVDIDLNSRPTVITGENGTGKTTILNLLGLAFGESIQLMGTPVRGKEGFSFRPGRRPIGEFDQVGLVTLSSGASSRIGVRSWEGPR